jgi:hypothetical protein
MVSDEESENDLESEKLEGWATEESTDYKVNEMKTAKVNWIRKIRDNSRIYQTLHQIDGILRKNSVNLRFQVSEHKYSEKTFNMREISELTLRITDGVTKIRKVDNHFFQNIRSNGLTRVKDTPLRFEIGGAYGESVRIFDEDFSNIRLEIPTMQSFFNTRIEEESLKHHPSVLEEE